MYSPKHNLEEDTGRLCAFMKAHSFATLVTLKDNAPRATHLPFMVEMIDERIKLYAHMAKANGQWKDFSDGLESLVIFQEPHAYVSPRHYESQHNVPTWNYVAVHFYGHAEILEKDEDKLHLLERLIREHDEDYFLKWKEMPRAYIDAKLSGIVAFKIDSTRIEARFKLSQDRSERERRNIIGQFEKSDDTLVHELGELMRERER